MVMVVACLGCQDNVWPDLAITFTPSTRTLTGSVASGVPQIPIPPILRAVLQSEFLPDGPLTFVATACTLASSCPATSAVAYFRGKGWMLALPGGVHPDVTRALGEVPVAGASSTNVPIWRAAPFVVTEVDLNVLADRFHLPVLSSPVVLAHLPKLSAVCDVVHLLASSQCAVQLELPLAAARPVMLPIGFMGAVVLSASRIVGIGKVDESQRQLTVQLDLLNLNVVICQKVTISWPGSVILTLRGPRPQTVTVALEGLLEPLLRKMIDASGMTEGGGMMQAVIDLCSDVLSHVALRGSVFNPRLEFERKTWKVLLSVPGRSEPAKPLLVLGAQLSAEFSVNRDR